MVLAVWVCLDVLQQYRCIGSKRGICQPHVPLSGQTKSGAWRTKIAEPYPWQLTQILATAFSNTELSRIAMEFSRHL